MARIVIVGGAGHVGTYLVPRLVEAGHQLVNVTRGLSRPWLSHAAWAQVECVVMDRAAEEAAGRFGASIAGLNPDIVIDMICFTPDSAAQLADALEGRVQHFLHVGTIWVNGSLTTVPAREEDPRAPFGQVASTSRTSRACFWTAPAAAACPQPWCAPAISSGRDGRH